MLCHVFICFVRFFCLFFFFAEPVSKPELNIQPKKGYAVEGQEMTLVCSVEGGSLPVSFTWYHTKDKVPKQLGSVTVNKRSASHKVSNLKSEHQGDYYCVSTNAANEAKRSPTETVEGGYGYLFFCCCCFK